MEKKKTVKTCFLKCYLKRLSHLKHDFVHHAVYNLGYIHLAEEFVILR